MNHCFLKLLKLAPSIFAEFEKPKENFARVIVCQCADDGGREYGVFTNESGHTVGALKEQIQDYVL